MPDASVARVASVRLRVDGRVDHFDDVEQFVAKDWQVVNA